MHREHAEVSLATIPCTGNTWLLVGTTVPGGTTIIPADPSAATWAWHVHACGATTRRMSSVSAKTANDDTSETSVGTNAVTVGGSGTVVNVASATVVGHATTGSVTAAIAPAGTVVVVGPAGTVVVELPPAGTVVVVGPDACAPPLGLHPASPTPSTKRIATRATTTRLRHARRRSAPPPAAADQLRSSSTVNPPRRVVVTLLASSSPRNGPVRRTLCAQDPGTADSVHGGLDR